MYFLHTPTGEDDQWWIQDFPEGAPIQEGALTYYLAYFCQNGMEMKKIGLRTGEARAPLRYATND